MENDNDLDHFEVLRKIKSKPNSSQRELASELGFSLGKLNYCIKALTEVGFIKLQNFSKSNNKSGYLYLLTSKGVKEKTNLTKRFLQKKQLEYEKLYNYFNGNEK